MTSLLSSAMPPERAPRAPVRWWLAAVLAVAIAGYALRYVIFGERAYVPELAPSFAARPWLIWAHALFGPIALVTGIVNLLPALRHPPRWILHRWTGRVYVTSALLTGFAGLGLSVFASGGTVARAGFALLALAVLGATTRGFVAIRSAVAIRTHREWMLRSYALIFAAVTLRIWLPLLIVAYGGQFVPAYRWVAWVSWVPNVIAVEWMIHRGWRPRFRLTRSVTAPMEV